MQQTLSSLCILFLFSTAALFAQSPVNNLGPVGQSPGLLGPLDSIVANYDLMSGHLLFDYPIPEETSLYSVGQYFGLQLDDVYLLNPKFKIGYEAGDKVRIPLPIPAIRPFIPYDSINYFAPVYYTFKKGETLYGLIHRVLKMESEDQLYLNNPNLTAQNVKVGQMLFIGWLSTEGITSEMQGELEDPYVRQNTGLREKWGQLSAGKKLNTQKGKAAWTNAGDRNKFMALHRTAPINSLIEIMDKRTGKTLYCRVVGPIPGQVYDQNVQVVVSPLLVKAFGVRDKYFYVQVKSYSD